MKMRVTVVAIILLGGILTLAHVCVSLAPETPQTPRSEGRWETLGLSLDRAIRSVRSIRIRSSDAPWVIMHALLAFGPDFEILDVKTREPVRVIDWVCTTGAPTLFQNIDGRLHPISRTPAMSHFYFEDHVDQWLYILSTCHIPLSQEIKLGEKSFTVGDLLATAKAYNASSYSEISAWTVPAFCHYTSSSTQWKNRFGETMTTRDLATKFLKQADWRNSSCRGTHCLYALASLRATGVLKGKTAAQLDRVLDEALRLLQRNQNADGAWMYDWHSEKDRREHVFYTMHITGHHLEWVAEAVTVRRLNGEWVKNGVTALVSAIDQISMVTLEKELATHPEVYGNLCHAVRGLRLTVTKQDLVNSKGGGGL